MNDELESKRKALGRITEELNDSRLSRRGLLDRLKGLGVGFGAAFMMGIRESGAHTAADATARLKSSNSALNDIIEEAPQPRGADGAPGGEDRPVQTSYVRAFRRVFRRVYSRI
jgi:hypothetical protein